MSQTVLSRDRNLSIIYQEEKKKRALHGTLLRILEGTRSFKWNCFLIISLLKIFVNTAQIEPYLFLIKPD